VTAQPNADNIRTILDIIDPNCSEQEWWEIACAVAHLAGEEGREPFREWSSQTHGDRDDFDHQVDRAYERNQQGGGWQTFAKYAPGVAYISDWTTEADWTRRPVCNRVHSAARKRGPAQVEGSVYATLASRGLPLRASTLQAVNDPTNAILSLFRPTDMLCSGDKYATTPVPLTEHVGPYICPNPLLSSRCDAEILRHEYVVCEFDDKDKKSQAGFWSYMIAQGAPVAAVIDSGGKSLHVWLKVDETAQSWDVQVKQLLYDGYLTPLGADRKCLNPSRLSRLPGAIRPETDKLQTLWYFNPACPVGVQAFTDIFTEFTLDSLDFCDIEDNPPPLTWVVQDWVLKEPSLTLFTGRGGGGKSLLSLQLGIALAAGMPWLGLPVLEPTRVLMAMCEDPKNVIALRRWAIIDQDPEIMDAIEPGMLQILPRIGEDNAIGQMEGNKIVPGPFYFQLKSKLASMGSEYKVLVIDTLMDVFHGEENDRTAVGQFTKQILFRLALDHNCWILVLAHPPKSVEHAYSGSTAWQGAVRMMWVLQQDDREGVMRLDVDKSNYGQKPTGIPVRYSKGAFVVVDEVAVDQESKDAIMAYITTSAVEGDYYKAGTSAGGHRPISGQNIVDPFGGGALSAKTIQTLVAELLAEGEVVEYAHNGRNRLEVPR